MNIDKFRITLNEIKLMDKRTVVNTPPFNKNHIRPLEDCYGMPIIVGSIF